MSGEQFKRRRQARAVAISVNLDDVRRRLAERMLMAAAVGAAVVQGTWLIHMAMRTVQP